MTAPPSLLLPDGTPAPNGQYEGRVLDILTTQLDGPSWGARRFRRKAWLYFGVYTPEVTVGFAVVDAGYMATAFCYVYDVNSQQFLEEKAQSVFGFPRNFQPGWDTRWELRKGPQQWTVLPNGPDWKVTYRGKGIELHVTLSEPHPGLSAIAEGRPFHYTYKNTAVTANGTLRTGGKTYSLGGPTGVIDFSRGYPPRNTFWNWASLAGHTRDGISVGINLVGVFNAGRENGLWLGGQLIPTGPALFTYQKPPAQHPWHIRTEDGIVDMRFVPLGARSENLNLGIAKSIFTQPYGTFTGTLRHGGETIPFTGQGVVEEHLAKW